MATYSALPATLNLVATVGNDFTLSLTVTENGSPWVATGATLATDIIDSSGAVVATDFTTAASTGTVSLSLTDTNTTTLGVGVYSYRLSVTKSSLTRDWIAGTLSIVEAGQGGTSTSSASLSISNSAVSLSLTSLVAPLAENIGVADAGGYYTGTTVEAVLQEAALKEVAVALAAKASATYLPRIPAGVAGPTITNNASSGLSGSIIQSQMFNSFRLVGTTETAVSWNQTFNYLDCTANNGASAWGIETDFYGTSMEFAYRVVAGTSVPIWVWVNGVPTTDAPVTYSALTAGNTYLLRIVFGSIGQRRIKVFMDNGHLRYLKGDALTATFVASPPPPWRVAIVGDSFIEGAASVDQLNTCGFYAGILLGADVVTCGQGGSGYTSTGGVSSQTYTTAARLESLAATEPDLVVVVGSVNDDGDSGIQDAATSMYSQLATLLPNTPVVVFGPQPTSSTGSNAANRAASILAVQTAANLASNVIGFVDMVGYTAATVAYTGTPTVAQGDRVTYEGGVYEATQAQASAGAPNSNGYWRRIGPFYGTGIAGSTTGNGNRDLLVSSDGTHPTAAGHIVLAHFIAANTLRVLQEHAAA